MAVTLDATLSGATSNSYVDMTTALAIAQNIPGGGDWAVLDEEARNLSLIVATRWLETLTYGGDRCKDTQRLKWPRSGVSCDGIVSDCAGIPYRIQEAEVTLAIKYTTDPGLFPGSGSGGGAAAGTYVKRQKLGSLEVEYDQYSGTSVTSCDNCNDPAIITAFPWLKDILGCWIAGLSGGVGLMLRVRS
jgi:hypothetical protein